MKNINLLNKILDISDYNKKHLTKWAPCQNKDMLPFWIADMDFKVSPQIQKAMMDQAIEGHYGYCDTPAELNEVVIEKLKLLYNWEVTKDQIFWGTGLVTMLNIISRFFAGKSNSVIVPTPIYYHLFNAPDWGGKNTIRINIVKDKKTNLFDFDWEKIELAMKNGARLINLCNPLNPGGMVFRRWQLEKMADLCLKYDVLICSDEIHCDHILEEGVKHIPIGSLSAKIGQMAFTLMAPSKTYNIAGLGASFCIIQNKELMEKFRNSARGLLASPSIAGYRAALAGYSESSKWLADLIVQLRKNRNILYEFFEGHNNFEMQKPHEATYLAWIKIKNIETSELFKRFESSGVKVSDGKIFEGDGYFRFNFGCHENTLREGLNRIKQALA